MSRIHVPPYVRTIQRFLERIGAFVTRVRVGGRIVITWRFHGEHHETDIARHAADPAGYAARKIAEISVLAGLSGATA